MRTLVNARSPPGEKKEELMVAPRSLVWGGLGEGRACLAALVEVWSSEEISWASHVAFLHPSAIAKGGSRPHGPGESGNQKENPQNPSGKEGVEEGQQGVLLLPW